VKDDYLRYLFNRFFASSAFNQLVAEDWRPIENKNDLIDSIIHEAFKPYGLAPPPSIYRDRVDTILTLFEKGGAIRLEGDDYAGHHFSFKLSKKNELVAQWVNSGPAHSRISKLGEGVFLRALTKIVEEDTVLVSDVEIIDETAGIAIPASDRIVTLGHNQPEYQLITEGITALKVEVQAWNGSPDEPELRSRVLQGLEAAQALWAATELKVVQVKVGVIMAIEDAEFALRKIATLASGIALVKFIETFISNAFSGIDWGNL